MRQKLSQEVLQGVAPSAARMIKHVGRDGGSAGWACVRRERVNRVAVALRARGNRVFTFLCSLRPSPLPPSVGQRVLGAKEGAAGSLWELRAPPMLALP